MSRNTIIFLIYYRHKLLDLIYSKIDGIEEYRVVIIKGSLHLHKIQDRLIDDQKFGDSSCLLQPVTVAELSKACTVFARPEVAIMSSNPTQGMDV
jgi:hypothetical protein